MKNRTNDNTINNDNSIDQKTLCRKPQPKVKIKVYPNSFSYPFKTDSTTGRATRLRIATPSPY